MIRQIRKLGCWMIVWALCLLTACHSAGMPESSEEDAATYETFQSDTVGVSFSVPSDWYAEDQVLDGSCHILHFQDCAVSVQRLPAAYARLDWNEDLPEKILKIDEQVHLNGGRQENIRGYIYQYRHLSKPTQVLETESRRIYRISAKLKQRRILSRIYTFYTTFYFIRFSPDELLCMTCIRVEKKDPYVSVLDNIACSLDLTEGWTGDPAQKTYYQEEFLLVADLMETYYDWWW